PAVPFGEISLEEAKELLAALVLVASPDVNRKRSADVELLAETGSLRILRHVRPDPDDNPRHIVIAGGRLDHRALFVRVVHHRTDAAENRVEHRQTDGR